MALHSTLQNDGVFPPRSSLQNISSIGPPQSEASDRLNKSHQNYSPVSSTSWNFSASNSAVNLDENANRNDTENLYEVDGAVDRQEANIQQKEDQESNESSVPPTLGDSTMDAFQNISI